MIITQSSKWNIPKSLAPQSFIIWCTCQSKLKGLGLVDVSGQCALRENTCFLKTLWKCFKNLPYSVSMRHQLWMCWKQLGVLGKPSESYLGDIGQIQLQLNDELPIEIQVNLRAANLHVNQISETKDLSIKGHCYRPGCVLVLDYNNFWPSYGVVDKILVIDYQKFFLLTRLKVMEYDHHYLLLCKTFRYKASSEIPRSQVCLASVYS